MKKESDEFKKPEGKGMSALVLKNLGKVLVPKKEEHKKTLIEIIEDSKSGVPSKSEMESKEKKALLKKSGLGATNSKAGS